MRNRFVSVLLGLMDQDPSLFFITGDLGFNAFEPIQLKFPERFINAGIAEQAMVGIAAGLAKSGKRVVCYSIAPFITYRCLEQIRIDICFHQLPVLIVGNGGGYQYGLNGPTHHALSDLACMSSLPHLTCHIPADSNQVETIIKSWYTLPTPCYLRLGQNLTNSNAQTNPSTSQASTSQASTSQASTSQASTSQASTSQASTSQANTHPYTHANTPANAQTSPSTPKMIAIGLGPLATDLITHIANHPIPELQIWACTQLPLKKFDPIELNVLNQAKAILTFEDHTERGGMGEAIAIELMKQCIHPAIFESLSAQQDYKGQYGDQTFHHFQSRITPEQIYKRIQIIQNQISKSSYANT